MIFAPSYTRHERTIVRRLRLLGLDHECADRPRHDFRVGLRDRLMAEATARHDDPVAC